ncbi:MAG: ATP-binding protein, partial [Methylococcaceae bacterium]|nr:ATP-binding protein [Methylococcaceae bacterium]
QQPLLTFLSMGTAEGEYFSASRPPLGDDKRLRVLQATIAEDRVMNIFRVDESNWTRTHLSVGNKYFDARTRPWFKAAVASDRIRWYPAYRYLVQDDQGVYDALGMGMSAPLYDAKNQFIGVVTADVALSQLSSFLKSQSSDTGGLAFISEQNGELLATSDDESVYRLEGDKTLRVNIKASDNPIVREAGNTLQRGGGSSGDSFITVNKERYLFNWTSIQLPDGPSLVIGVMLPESQFIGPVDTALSNMYYLAVAIMLISVLVTLLATDWVSKPLESLNRWADQLAQGNWRARPPLTTPIHEVSMLSATLGNMARTLEQNIDNLEHRVAERTHELELANRQLAKLSEAKSAFLAKISHELRSPLNTIIGFSRMLSKGSPRLSLQDGSKGIEKSGIRLLGLIDELLDESRLEAGQLALAPEHLLLQPWLEDLRHTMTIDALARGNHFSLICSGQIPAAVILDGGRLRQVLDNLFGNANRHTHNGEIRLACHASLAQEKGEASHASLTFSIIDSGEGIEPADLKRIFEPFTRGQGSGHDQQRKGFGLGLSISTELLRLMGSTISVTSTRGIGSTFQFTLDCPVASADVVPHHKIALSASKTAAKPEPEQASPAPLPPTPAHLSNGMVALVVEDDPEQQQLLAMSLEEVGYQVYTASSGQEAAALLEMQAVNIIMTDQMMDEGDGWFVLQQARNQHPAVPVVLLSAAPPQPPADIANDMMFDAVLLKPVPPERLVATLWRVMLKVDAGGTAITQAQWKTLADLSHDGDVSGIEEWIAQRPTSPTIEWVRAALHRLDLNLLQRVARMMSC